MENLPGRESWFTRLKFRLVHFFIPAVATCAALTILNAVAAEYPTKPVRMVVPFAPGGPADIFGRAVGQRLTERLGQLVVIDNRGGGGGNIGAEIVSRSLPDGYTIFLGTPGVLISNPAMGKVAFDTMRDFAPVVLAANMSSLMVLHPSVPARNVKEFIDYARARPGQLTYGSSGNGSASHLATELFKLTAKVNMSHVPYKGAAPAVTDLLAGNINVMVIGVPAALPFVRAGRLTALGVASPQRHPSAMDLPTIAESGLPGFEIANWFAVLAPKGTPAAIVSRLNTELNSILHAAETRERFLQQGFENVGGTPDQLSAYLRTENDKWTKVVREAHIRAD